MDSKAQLKLQAFLDGELPEKEARQVASWIAQDSEATALSNELRNTRKALKDSEPKPILPESREFYWSKIRRDLERLEPVQPEQESPSIFKLWRRIWIPAGSLAVIMIVLAGIEFGFRGGSAFGPDTEMTVADSGAFTYHDYANGTTLVWVSYPAER